MRTLAVCTPDPPVAKAAAQLDGRTAVVRADTDGGTHDKSPTDSTHDKSPTDSTHDKSPTDSTHDELPTEPAAEFRVAADGSWRGTVAGDEFRRLLDRLAPDYEYLLLAGRSALRLPTVVAGDAEPAGRVVHRVRADEPLTATEIAERARDVEPYVTLESLVSACKRAPDRHRAGAIATFTGRVRAKDSPEDVRTTHLEFEQYDQVAAERLDTIESELTARDEVFDVRTHHRTGLIEAGEDIVFVVVLAGHREQAFEAVSDGINRLKSAVPIFKKEITTQDAHWKHEDR